MVRKRIITSIFLFGVLLNGHILYSQEELYENPNEISNYYMGLIDNNTMKTLSMLEIVNENLYNIVIGFIPENEIIENYYYTIGISIKINENEEEQMIIDENGIIHLPEHTTLDVTYFIYYYEYFFNRYRSYRGDPTGKCFSVILDKNNEFIKVEYWR
jgi:hypothetical protein